MPAKVLLFNEEAMIKRLRAEVERAGSQSEFAREAGVARVTLNRVLHGRRNIPPSFWRRLKIKQIYLASTGQLNASGVLSLLRSEIKRSGGLSAWSLKTGIHRSVVSKVLHRRMPITQSVLEALDVQSALTSSLSSSAEKGQAAPSRTPETAFTTSGNGTEEGRAPPRALGFVSKQRPSK